MTIETIQPKVSLDPPSLDFGDKVVTGKPYHIPLEFIVCICSDLR